MGSEITILLCLLLFKQVFSQSCTIEDFAVQYAGVPVFRVVSKNNTCTCDSFSGPGTSRLNTVRSAAITTSALDTAQLRFPDNTVQSTAFPRATSCPAGSYMTGVNASGAALCTEMRGYPGADCGTTANCLAPLQCINYRCSTDFNHVWVDAGLTSSYPGTGTTWTDISGNNNHCAFVGTPLYQSVAPSFMKPNGANQYFSCGSVSAQLTDSERSFEAWVYPTSNSTVGPIVDRYNHGIDHQGQLSSFSVWIRDDSTFKRVYSPPGSAPPNSWYHMVGIYKANAFMKVYVNGVLTTTDTDVTAISTTYSASSMFLGYSSQNSGMYFPGNVAMVRVYRRVLSDNDVRNLFSGVRSRFGV
eukprot:TRINITY_DN5534_c0_g1_i1.p1 TRINITY_DN5534_c0_g1~~TRINITY_DN5534_c0_g1_i1.p1  ORF type:complete len:358 (+),score=105.29 TRINITY_DN5534_c0_g1_i1:193-1266(+)